MNNFIEKLFANVNKDSKVFVFIPPDFLSLFLVSEQYLALFLFIEEKLNIYPKIVYYKKESVGNNLHKLFFGHGHLIQWSKVSLVNEIKNNKYKAGFFCWKYRYIADYCKIFFGISIQEVKPGGCYFLHVPKDGEPKLTVVTKDDLLNEKT